MPRLKNQKKSKNFIDLTGVTSKGKLYLDALFRNLTWDRDSEASFKDPFEHYFRHKYRAPPLSKNDLLYILMNPYSIGETQELGQSPAPPESKYRDRLLQELEKRYPSNRSDGGYKIQLGK